LRALAQHHRPAHLLTRQEAPAVPGVPPRPRVGAPDRASPRRALHRRHGPDLPHWRHLRQELNAAPLAHETWTY